MGVSKLGSNEQDRLTWSGLIGSQMMGFALMRHVWKIEPIASMPDDEVVAAIAPNLPPLKRAGQRQCLLGLVVPTLRCVLVGVQVALHLHLVAARLKRQQSADR
jgi:hypothetical protein